MNSRITNIERETKETKIIAELNLDGARNVSITTGLGFFDHMLTSLAFHAGWDLKLDAKGDLHVDDHHTIEDCGIILGTALYELAADKSNITRFSSRYAPLDEALARCVCDVSGRPYATVKLQLKGDRIGNVACENLDHFFRSLASAAKITLHVDVLRGENDHHRAEAAFKATALAIKDAFEICSANSIPSTKGVLTS